MNEPEKPALISLIIVCHNDGKWLPRCLESVQAQTFFDQIEVIVADNASADGTDRVAQNLIAGWPRARFLSTGGDHGFGVACNRAAEVAKGEFLFLLNPDTWLEADCVERFIQTLERERAGAAGGTVLNYGDMSIQSEGGTGFDFCGNAVVGSGARQSDELMCPGCFFFIRKDLFERVGAMDTRWFLYGEEMDLSWRIWVSGERVVAARSARVHHQGAVNVNTDAGAQADQNRTSVQKRFLANRNRLLFLAKNCQHLLLVMLLPCALLVLLEGLVTLLATRNRSLSKATAMDAFAGAWRLRRHIRAERRRIASFRRHGDIWMLRFFRFGFGRWGEVAKIIRKGFPRFK